ncbi:hypothetical protein AHAS_Ahas14G0128600 [Arachis hypogaea]
MACWDPTKPRYNNELATERARSLKAEEDEDKWEQQLKEQKKAREHHSRDEEGEDSQSSKDEPKDQQILDIPDIEISSGKERIREGEKIGGEKIEEEKEASPLAQGSGSELREICLLNVLRGTLQNLKEAKGRNVERTKEVTQKEKMDGAEEEKIKRANSDIGPSNWFKPKDVLTREENTTKKQAQQEFINLQMANEMGSTKMPPSGLQAKPTNSVGHNTRFLPQGNVNQADLLKNQQESWRQHSEDIWEEVLSIGMQYNLKIKRKRDDSGGRNITELNWEGDQESRISKRNKIHIVQEGSSRPRAEQGIATTAEEAGLIMPPPQP